MDAKRWEKVRIAFEELAELTPAERAHRLTALGATDPECRRAVELLLRADADADASLSAVESPPGLVLPPRGDTSVMTDAEIQARLQNALGSAYHIERELGGGGMSRVYVASETAFQRRVVVKVLRPELSEAVSARRFQREIQLAARLQHPHIVPLLSAGEADGLLYYTMPFVEGESLRDRLRRQGNSRSTKPFASSETLRAAWRTRTGMVSSIATSSLKMSCCPRVAQSWLTSELRRR
jgi:serine/threonine-protein kinase